MRRLRIGLAQINPTVGDLDGNFQQIVAAIERARAQHVDLLDRLRALGAALRFTEDGLETTVRLRRE